MKRALALMVVMVIVMMVMVAAEEENKEKDDRPLHKVSPEDARIIAAMSTWTQLSFVSTTTTVLYTCYLLLQNTVACKKRRLRKYSALQAMDVVSEFDGLDGSFSPATREGRDFDPSDQGLAETPSFFQPEDDEASNAAAAGTGGDGSKTGKLAITVWSSVTSTYTMSMTSINSATTFSVSFMCTVAGASYPPACG